MHERLKAFRKELRLNQAEVAKRINCSQAAIASYESGARTPLPAIIKSICREFNVREEWLLTGEGEMFETAVEDLVAQLAKEHDLGPGGTAFLRVIVQIFDAVGPDEMDNIFANVIPQMRAQAAADLASGDEPLIGMLNDRQISGDAEQESV